MIQVMFGLLNAQMQRDTGNPSTTVISVDPTSITLNAGNPEPEITITATGTWWISSDNTYIAFFDSNGNEIVFEQTMTGNQVVTVKLEAGQTNYSLIDGALIYVDPTDQGEGNGVTVTINN